MVATGTAEHAFEKRITKKKHCAKNSMAC